jgi:hypothetical protein
MTKTEAYDLAGMTWIELFPMTDDEIARCAAGDDGYDAQFYAVVTVPCPHQGMPHDAAQVAVWFDAQDVADIIAENPTVPVRVPVPWQVFDVSRRRSVQPYEYHEMRANMRMPGWR